MIWFGLFICLFVCLFVRFKFEFDVPSCFDIHFFVAMTDVTEDDDWCESMQEASDTEEYFEDFHLPMTHQNSMSTRRSFIRKVKSVDLHVPDADRIEGIVKSGQLIRHGSIRRKIVPQPSDFILSAAAANDIEASIRLESIADELAPLDDETLSKIKDCLDGERLKDIYTLGSRLQDLLSPCEIEEIISNSHRYGDVITNDIVLVLKSAETRNSKTESKSNQVNRQAPDLIDTNDNRNFLILVSPASFPSLSFIRLFL